MRDLDNWWDKPAVPSNGLQGHIVSDAEAALAGKRGLVLEDEFLIALDIEELLQGAGAEVVCVARIDKALEAVEGGGPYDFAILDRYLGSATSAAVAVALAGRNIPFLFLTGSRGLRHKDEAMPDAPIVEKPYQPEALVKAVRELVEGRQRRERQPAR